MSAYSGPVTDDAHVHADIVLLGRTRQGERVILEMANFWTVDKHILARSGRRVFLLDLHFEDFRGMEDDLGNVRYVSGYIRDDQLDDLENLLCATNS